ncbi:hypothetical protein [Sphingomonas cavernae]|uniref:Uncharacterized protein n=1 Tax=Sphingomonas cavernae TaxID=2320861 RepID=A0A418WSX4_9SPHN|nr:hypothetical protein [Sphingomonas cavernae]RJF94307.1 hypothetical protein D3876_07300 [Sphingomonas cavernae]
MRRSVLGPVLGLLMLPAACVAPKAPPPAPPPAPVAPPPAPPPAPLSSDWRDWPVTGGDWSYRPGAGGSSATFGRLGATPELSVQCDRATRRITLARAGVLVPGKSARLTLRATEGATTYAVSDAGGAPPRVAATVAASDPFLDKIAFSRGRVLVQLDGAQDIVVPNWAEFARVVEDCRG